MKTTERAGRRCDVFVGQWQRSEGGCLRDGAGINSQHEEDTDRTCPHLLHSGMVWDAETSRSTSQPHFIAHYGGKEVFFILNY